MTVGEKIRRLRRQNDWTQQELGRRSGIDGKNVSAYESGRLNATPKTLARFANAFGVTIEELQSEEPIELTLNSEDPELIRLASEVSKLSEPEREHARWFLSLMIKQNRLQQVLAS